MIAFRPALREHASAIRDFQIQMALETENLRLDSEICEKGVHAVFDDPSKGRYFIAQDGAEDGGHVIGSLLITYEWSDWRNGTIWWIQSVYIKPEYRGQKVFSKFYRTIQKAVQDDGSIRGLRLYVEKRNSHAQKVYQTLGMKADHYDLYEWMKSF